MQNREHTCFFSAAHAAKDSGIALMLLQPFAGLLAAADGTALAGEIAAVLRKHGDDVLACLLPMLRAAGPEPSTPLEELARDCERRLTAITELPARAWR